MYEYLRFIQSVTEHLDRREEQIGIILSNILDELRNIKTLIHGLEKEKQ